MMNPEELKKIKMAFAGMAELFQRPAYSDGALKMVASVLGDLEFKTVMSAIDTYVKTTKFNRPPTPGELREIISPNATAKDEARLLSARIIGCISRYGYTWSTGAMAGGRNNYRGAGKDHETFEGAVKSEIGDAGWHTVKILGGWDVLCKREDGTGFLQAQIRDTCESVIIKAKNGTLETPLSLDGEKKLEIASNVKALAGGAINKLEEA